MRKLLFFSLVFFLSFQISGQTWSPLKRLSWTSDESMYPTIATVSTSVIHVVWQDTTPGNKEIYYKNRK